MMIKQFLCSTVIGTLMLLSTGCGGSSDHGNGRYSTVTGKVIKPNGDPATDTKIRIVYDTLNYFIDSSSNAFRESLTDENGLFAVDSVLYGNYCISGVDSWSHGEFVLKRVEVAEGQAELGIIELAIPGTVIFPVDSLGVDSGMILYFPGLPIFHVVDTGAIQWIDGIPAGEVELRGYDPVANSMIDLGVQYHIVNVPSGRSLFLAYRLDIPWYCPGDSTVAFRELEGIVGEEYRFSVVSLDVRPAGEYFRFSWGDGTESVWSRGYDAVHIYDRPGVYSVQSQMRYGETFVAWSEPLVITIRESEQ